MTRIFITRHGETAWNIEKRMQGWKDSPLTDLGLKQATWLGERLENEAIDVIYSSPLNRAYKTAQLIKGNRNIDIVKLEDLREVHLGEWEGRTVKEIEDLNPKEIENFFHAPHLYNPPHSGESYEDVKNRAHKTIKSIIEKHEGENILIVTHAVTLKILMLYFEERPLEKLWEPPYIHQTSLTEIELSNNVPVIKMYADVSHYKDEVLR